MLPTITNAITLANCRISIMGTIFRSVPLSTLPSLQRWQKSWSIHRKKAHNNEDKDGSNSPNQTYLQGDLSSTKTSCALNLWDSLQIRAPSLINSIESPASADASIRYPIAQISTSWPCPSRKISGEWFSFINSSWANVGGVVASSQSIKTTSTHLPFCEQYSPTEYHDDIMGFDAQPWTRDFSTLSERAKEMIDSYNKRLQNTYKTFPHFFLDVWTVNV